MWPPPPRSAAAAVGGGNSFTVTQAQRREIPTRGPLQPQRPRRAKPRASPRPWPRPSRAPSAATTARWSRSRRCAPRPRRCRRTGPWSSRSRPASNERARTQQAMHQKNTLQTITLSRALARRSVVTQRRRGKAREAPHPGHPRRPSEIQALRHAESLGIRVLGAWTRRAARRGRVAGRPASTYPCGLARPRARRSGGGRRRRRAHPRRS